MTVGTWDMFLQTSVGGNYEGKCMKANLLKGFYMTLVN